MRVTTSEIVQKEMIMNMMDKSGFEYKKLESKDSIVVRIEVASILQMDKFTRELSMITKDFCYAIIEV